MAQKKITELTLRNTFDGTCNVPVDDTSQTWRVTGSQVMDYVNTQLVDATASNKIKNLGLAASVASNALTIALKQQDGTTNPTALSPVKIGFRSTALSSGAFNERSVTAALSTVISSGSTAGHASNVGSPIYVYAIDNAGTVVLGWSTSPRDETALQTTVAEGGAGAADSINVLYSSGVFTSVPVRLIARIRSTQTTAGTWSATPSAIALTSQATPTRVLISKAIASSSATIEFTGLDKDEYDSFEVVCTNVIPANSAVDFYLRLSSSGTFVASGYHWNSWRWTTSGSGVSGEAGTGTAICLSAPADQLVNTALFGSSFVIRIFSPAQNTSYHKLVFQGQALCGLQIGIVGSGIYTSINPIDGIRLLMSSGNISSGEFALYGMRK